MTRPVCCACRCVVVMRWIASIRRRAARLRLGKPLMGRFIESASRPTKRVTTRTTSHNSVLSVG